MRDPVSATRSGDGLPVVIGDVPDKTILRLDVAVDAVARRGDSVPALFTVVLAKDDRH